MVRDSLNPRLLLRTSAFQLAVIHASLFTVSALVLFGILYWATLGSISRQIDATIETEIFGLAEQYERYGMNGLVDVLSERARRTTDNRAIYLFADSKLNPIAGNLKKWPSVSLVSDGKIGFETSLDNGKKVRFRANILSVGSSYRLLVGRDVREIDAIKRLYDGAAIWGIAAVLLLAVAGGAVIGSSSRNRVASINRTTRRIIAGDLSERVAVTGARDEYDDLAVNINEMLTQIEILLENVRHVGDSVAHDLKTPLTRLRNRLESLSQSDDSKSAELQKCVQESDRLLATFNALLRIARIESGAYRTEFSVLKLSEIVEGVCELYRAAADDKGIALSYSSAPSGRLRGDRELLTQALANLLDNAVKYTPKNGSIDVSIKEHADRIELVIRDNGPGVPSSDHGRIQQRFVRLDAARSEPGNGLGLSLVRAVADQHRGELLLDNLDPGLRLTMVLPRNIDDTHAA